MIFLSIAIVHIMRLFYLRTTAIHMGRVNLFALFVASPTKDQWQALRIATGIWKALLAGPGACQRVDRVNPRL